MTNISGSETSIVSRGSPARSTLATLLQLAFTRATALDSRLPEGILAMQGMSGRKYRRLINTLIGSVPDARYLEIGSWMGSTACSAMFLNKAKVFCIDNWSEFGGPKDVFLNNVGVVRQDFHEFEFLESDFRKVDYGRLGKHNVYLFDGPHEYQDQLDGVMVAQDALDEEYVLIVDDWNYERVRSGTFDGLRRAGSDVLFSIEIRTTQDGSHCQQFGPAGEWHNGYFLGVVQKSREAGSSRARPADMALAAA